jgi:hypothetical protein
VCTNGLRPQRNHWLGVTNLLSLLGAVLLALSFVSGVAGAQTQSSTGLSPALVPRNVPPDMPKPPLRRRAPKIAKVGRADTTSPSPPNVTGSWNDTYGYAWILTQSQSGSISGSVNVGGCVNPIWSVYGTLNGTQLSLNTINPAGGDEVCDSGFSYDLALSADGNSASGPWTSDYGSGTVTMSRVSTTPSIQITLLSQPDINEYYISTLPAMPVIQATAAVIGVTPDPTSTTVFTWNAHLKILENGGTGSEVDYDDDIMQNVTTTGTATYTLTLVDDQDLLGGELTLTVTAMVNGQMITGTTPASLSSGSDTEDPLEIYGTNPQRSAVQLGIVVNVPSKTYYGLQNTNVEDALQRIACEESGPAPRGQTQFKALPGETGPPIVAPDNGIGIMQITQSPDPFTDNPSIVFDWQNNIMAGIGIFQNAARVAAQYPGILRNDSNPNKSTSYQYYINNTVNPMRQAMGLMPINTLPAPNFTTVGNVGASPPNQLLEDAIRLYNGPGTMHGPFDSAHLNEFQPDVNFLLTVPNAQLSTLSTNPLVWTRVCSEPGNGPLFGPSLSDDCTSARGSSGAPAYVNNISANLAVCPTGARSN